VVLELGDRIPAERGIFFLRNKGVGTRMHRPEATEAEIRSEARFWRLVISAGTIVDRADRAHVPATYNASFLEDLEGRPFDAVLAEVRSYGTPPETSTTFEDDEPPATPLTILLILGVGAFLLFASTGVLRRSPGA
jgi:hypothetical protein